MDKLEAAKALLLEMEWCVEDYGMCFCRYCGGIKPGAPYTLEGRSEGHTPDCRLMKVLSDDA